MKTQGIATTVRPLVEELVGRSLPVAVRFWDGSSLGPPDAPATLVVSSPRALRRILYSPNELGLSRAYVAGELDVEGDLDAAFALREVFSAPEERVEVRVGVRDRIRLLAAARRIGALGLPVPAPPEEARLGGNRHSRQRDAAAITHHYDVSDDFYRIVLGETMTYSCAYFPAPDTSLDDAQRAKYDLICRKLGLRPGMRLLDVGCGWGGMVMHAAENYGVSAVGITISPNQARLAGERVQEAGLSSRAEIRMQDYRDVTDGPYDSICSIGMFEHVGLSQLSEYLEALERLLAPQGRLLNHGISRPPGRPLLGPDSFISRYVFPDGELHEVGSVVSAVQKTRLEVRDVESLREHYERTLRHWTANLESSWDKAVGIVGPARARIWRLYMTGSAIHFGANRISVHQVLAVKTDERGQSGMPPTRAPMLEGQQKAAL